MTKKNSSLGDESAGLKAVSPLASSAGSTALWGVGNELSGWIKADSRNDWKSDNWELAVELRNKLHADGARGIQVREYSAP